jgi:protoporphyrinogen oxidase
MDLIIGAGISGLTYAANCGHDDYLILERDNSIGGYCKTINQDGFIWDYSGHFFHFQNEDVKLYVLRKMDMSNLLSIYKHTQIYYNEIYVDYPFQKNIHQLEKNEFIDCIYDLFINNHKDDSTFKGMLYAEFGTSIAEKFLIPYNEKLYACNLNSLDVNAMGRFFPHVDKMGIISNFKRVDDSSYNSHFIYPKYGAIEFVNSINSRVDNLKISINEEVISIDLKKKKVHTNRRVLNYDNLISTIPLPHLLNSCGIQFDRTLYSWNKVLVFNLGFDKKGADVKNNWVYFPEKKYSFYRVGYYDNIFNTQRMSLYVEVGFHKDANIDMEENLQNVLADLNLANIIDDQKLVSYSSVVMDPAYVYITDQMEKDKLKQFSYLNTNDIYSIGRYGGWKYCSIEDNIIEAIELSLKICSK